MNSFIHVTKWGKRRPPDYFFIDVLYTTFYPSDTWATLMPCVGSMSAVTTDFT